MNSPDSDEERPMSDSDKFNDSDDEWPMGGRVVRPFIGPLNLGGGDLRDVPEEEDDEEDAKARKEFPYIDSAVESVLSMHDGEFRVENFESFKIGQKWMSPTFETSNGLKFELVVFPGGNNGHAQNVSVFLNLSVHNSFDKPKYSVFTIFEISILHQDSTKSFRQHVKHCYQEKIDWGWNTFFHRSKLVDRGFFDDQGGVRFRVQVAITTGTDYNMWGTASHYDSKTQTGMVGIQNQGATCYMNSILQTLFHTKALRQAVFLMPTNSKDVVDTKNVALALQRVFYHLQMKPSAIETTQLTVSFGWTTVESFMQHDVQEFSRVLLDNLENKMAGTGVDGTIAKLFRGSMKSYIKCTEVDYESSRVETYYDIQLNVKKMGTLYNSFKNFTEAELLDGDNKYQAEGHGLQPAKKGIIFQSFPPVLHLQLKRFEYDMLRDENFKVDDRFEFPERMNLDEFLEAPDPVNPANYSLHAVLVHSGGIHGGHYVAFIMPHMQGLLENPPTRRWYKFDDDFVVPCKPSAAIKANFGAVQRFTSAYMLVYIRDSLINELCPEEVTVPPELALRFGDEDKKQEEAALEQQRQRALVRLHVYTDSVFAANKSMKLLERGHPGPFKTYTLEKITTLDKFVEQVAGDLGVPPDALRLWPYSTALPSFRENPFPSKTIPATSSLSLIVNRFAMQQTWGEPKQDLNMYAEVIPEYCRGVAFDGKADTLVFVKEYNALSQECFYRGHAIVSVNDPSALILERSQALVDPEKKHAYVSHVYTNDVNPLRQIDPAQGKDLTCFQYFKADGVVIVLERDDLPEPSTPAPPSVDGSGPAEGLPVPFVRHFDIVSHLLKIKVHDLKPSAADPSSHDVFELALDSRSPYIEVAKAVASKAGIEDPLFIQFYKSYFNCKPSSIPVQYNSSMTLEQMLELNNTVHRDIFFEKLTYSLKEFEMATVFQRCVYFDLPSFTELPLPSVLVAQGGTVRDLIDSVLKEAKVDPAAKKFRVLQLWGSKIERVYNEADFGLSAESLNVSYYSIRVEEIPADQLVLEPDERLATVFHFNHYPGQSFGSPFFVKVKQGEKIADIRARILGIVRAAPKEFESWKLCRQTYYYSTKEFKPEDEMDFALFEKLVLCLEHHDKMKKSHFAEKAIKIHN